jgi:hypothetical protein
MRMDKEICCFTYQLLDDLFTLVRGESRDYQLEVTCIETG